MHSPFKEHVPRPSEERIPTPSAPPEQLHSGATASIDLRIPTPERDSAETRKIEEDIDMDGSKRRRLFEDETMNPEDLSYVNKNSAIVEPILSQEDKHIIARILTGHDITEMYSPVRVNQLCDQFGLKAGASMDLTTGWDLSQPSQRNKAWKYIKDNKPFCIIGSPPCTYLSMLQELCKAVHGKNAQWMETFERNRIAAIVHIDFCARIYQYQLRNGLHLIHEHPWIARSWGRPTIKQLLDDHRVILVQAHQCQYGLTTRTGNTDANGETEYGPAKKPTGFMTSGHEIAKHLFRTCDNSHEHIPLMGGRAAAAAMYPEQLCREMCKGVAAQKLYDNSQRVHTKSMCNKELSSFV